MTGGDGLAGVGEEMDTSAAARAEEALSRFLPAADVGIVRAHHVTAFVVSRQGAQWLPRTLGALAAQSRAPDDCLGIDAGSGELGSQLLAATLPAVLDSDPDAGLAGALAVAAQAVGGSAGPEVSGDPEGDRLPVRWYWIVHDDSAPAPDCLENLLKGADRNPAAQVLIPKTVSWSDPGRLVGIGSRWAPGQPVLDRLDPGERDQGQYDVDRPVYTGNSAGMLVRADVWHRLGGMHPRFGGWAGPTEFCRRVWGAGGEVAFIPQAVLAHRQAGERGLRTASPEASPQPSPRRVARHGQLLLDLTQAPAPALPWRWIRAWFSTAVRALALLLTREPEVATDEVAGAWSALAHPGRLRAARAAARRPPATDLARPASVRARRGAGLSHSLDMWQSGARRRPGQRWRIQQTTWRPLLIAGVLACAALVRAPSHLLGSGTLRGGGLLPAPGADELLAAYLASWQDVRFGLPTAQPAYLPLLAASSLPVLGSVDLLLRLLFTLAVPIAFLSAYASIGPHAVGRYRIWLALAWAVLPAGVAAMAGGRISTLAVLLLGPPAARLSATAFASRRTSLAGIRPLIAAGTVLGLLVAFAPMVLLLALVVGAGAWLLLDRSPRGLRSGVVVLSVASVFLLPWLPRIVAAPWLLLTDLGRNDLALGDPAPAAWALSPGGPTSVLWAGVPLVVVTVVAVAVLTPTARMLSGLAGALALLGAVAWMGPGVQRVWPQVQVQTLWPGQSLLVAGGVLALLLARVAARRGSGSRIVSRAFLACVAVLGAGWWMAQSTMSVGTDSGVPAVVALDSETVEQPRALVLARAGQDVQFAVATGPLPRLGDADALAAPNSDPGFTEDVQDLVSGAGGDVELDLGSRGIRYVIFNGPQSDPLVADLDASAGLRRLASSVQQSLWLVAGQPVRAELVEQVGSGGPADETPDAPEDSLVVPVATTPTSIDVVLHPQAPVPRDLMLAERAEAGWRAELAGEPLELAATEQGMLTAPISATGSLVVRHEGLWPALAGAHLVVMAVLALLALPKRRIVDLDEELP